MSNHAKTNRLLSLLCGAMVADLFTASAAEPVSLIRMAELKAAAEIVRDSAGVAHITAQNDHDLFFLQGYVHAQDRLFQMDVTRRLASGSLAELLGTGALAQDVQLRTIGLRRAAERSLAAQSSRMQLILHAYAAGVNAYVRCHPLPAEYTVLELSRFEPWTSTDSLTVAKLVTFQRSFDIDIDPTVTLLTYQQAGQVVGFHGAALYFEDLFRTAPFDPTITASADRAGPEGFSKNASLQRLARYPQAPATLPNALQLAREYLDLIKTMPVMRDQLERDKHAGSNEWGISGAHTTTGYPLFANDTHLPLGVPNLFHPVHLSAGRLNAAGSSVAGVPTVILGHNQRISWGATVSYVDVTDTFLEQIVPDAASPSGLSIVHAGQLEPIIPVPEVFRINRLDGVVDNQSVVPPGGSIPPVTLIVPRRNHGPILSLDLAKGTALSIQYTGFSPTREIEAFLTWDEAQNIEDFQRGLPLFSVGSIHWGYSDTSGNIAIFSASEIPIREDLQAGALHGFAALVYS